MKKVLLILFVMVLSMGCIFAQGGVEKEEVLYGELDAGYVDKDGDLVADKPENSDDWLDPDTLIFAYAPVEDPAVYEEVFVDFQKYLEEKTGKNVKWFAVTSAATQIEAMRAGRLHISGFAAGSVQDAVNKGGFIPLAVMGTEAGFGGYSMEVIAHKDSGIKTVEDLKGKNIAFTSESSNSGFNAPRAILYQNFGLLPNEDYDVSFSGKHDNSITGVYNKDYDAGAIANTVLKRMIDGERIPSKDEWCVTIYESALFPPTAWGINHKLTPELQDAIYDAFMTYEWEGTLLKETWPENDRFTTVNYEKDYAVLRDVRAGSEKVAEILGE